MCTICGIATDEPDSDHPRIVREMLAATRHRGPDACGLWSSADGRVVRAKDPESLAPLADSLPPGRTLLAQSRLAITGGADALQPFTSRDGKLAFAHNGEVYNHEELKAILPSDSHVDTGSDSEVLARVVEALYRGDLKIAVRRAVEMATGMYAFAATDGETLVIARDPVGKKPIYYTAGPPFAFASERKAIAKIAARAGAPVKRLPPGHILAVRPGDSVEIERFGDWPEPAIDVLDEDEALAMYEAALEQSITRRTRGMTKAAVLFSGGVDSVLVARLLLNRGIEVTGYTMGMDGSGDVVASEAVAEEMGMNLKVMRVDEDMLERDLPDIIRAAEIAGPLQVEVAIPMWYASKMAHEDGHRVIFTGQAADELFAGYDWYRKVVRDQGHLELHARLWDDIRKLPEDTLEREDRITMAHSLELRAPFLDADLVRTAMRIAPQLKLTDPEDLMRKHTHRQAASRAGVPDSIAFREKIPAQDGASVHTLLQALAARRFPDGVPPDVPPFADFGSNYRYRDTIGEYASPEVHALIRAVVVEHRIVVCDAIGEIPAPQALEVDDVPRNGGGDPLAQAAAATALRST